jgi:shikimate dehydrogenase
MTEKYFLIGANVSRSPTPSMMNAAFEEREIDARYEALSIEPNNFEESILMLRREGVAGLNVTIPFKSSIVRFLDGLDETSAKVGAVNTVKREGPRYMGFNTDVYGVTEPLKQFFLEKGPRTAILVGSGGAARAFCEAMSKVGCESITVLVREPTRGKPFVEDMSRTFPKMSLTLEAIADVGVLERDLLFNATPIGSNGNPLPEAIGRVLGGVKVVFDAVYRPVETELLKKAALAGCKVVRGYEMLLNQAVAAFEIWTAQRAPKDVMERDLLDSLGREAT